MSCVVIIILFNLFLFLIKDSIQQTDSPNTGVEQGKLEPNGIESEEKMMKQSFVQKIIERLIMKLHPRLDTDFLDIITCLLKKFTYEEIMLMKNEKYMDEFRDKYDYLQDQLMLVINNEFLETNPNRIMILCQRVGEVMPSFWKKVTVYGTCMKPNTPVACLTHTYNNLRWQKEVGELFDNLNSIILKDVATEIKEYLLPLMETDDSYAQSYVNDLEVMRLFVNDLTDHKSGFMESYPDINQRTYLVLCALSMVPILANFNSYNKDKIKDGYISEFNKKMGGPILSLYFIRDFVYKTIPDDPTLHVYYERVKKLLSKYVDEEILRLVHNGEFTEDYAQKLLKTPNRSLPMRQVHTFS